MKNKQLKRVDGFEQRKAISGETGTGRLYICGCGSRTWLLFNNGDCVCNECRRAQVRIMVNEIAPVAPKGET